MGVVIMKQFPFKDLTGLIIQRSMASLMCVTGVKWDDENYCSEFLHGSLQ